MNRYFIASVVCIALWITLAFVVAWPSGWAHVPLVAAVFLLARAIVGHTRHGPM